MAVSCCVGNQCRDQLQNVFFAVNVLKRIVVHRLLEIDRVQNPDFIGLINDLSVRPSDRAVVLIQNRRPVLQQITAFGENTALWICDNIGAVHLHQIGLEPKPGLAGAGAADN